MYCNSSKGIYTHTGHCNGTPTNPKMTSARFPYIHLLSRLFFNITPGGSRIVLKFTHSNGLGSDGLLYQKNANKVKNSCRNGQLTSSVKTTGHTLDDIGLLRILPIQRWKVRCKETLLANVTGEDEKRQALEKTGHEEAAGKHLEAALLNRAAQGNVGNKEANATKDTGNEGGGLSHVEV